VPTVVVERRRLTAIALCPSRPSELLSGGISKFMIIRYRSFASRADGVKQLIDIHHVLFPSTAGTRVQLFPQLAHNISLQFSITAKSTVIVIPHSLILKGPKVQSFGSLRDFSYALIDLGDDLLKNPDSVLLLATTGEP
jgi:hypothetical protein